MSKKHPDTLKLIRKLLPGHITRRLPVRVAVIEISSAASRRINFQYCKKQKPANVLSFHYRQKTLPPRMAGHDYGEILVCPQVIRWEAKKQGNTYQYQMTWMILHGMLHLAGIHHESSRQLARRAERLEVRTLQKLMAKLKAKKSKLKTTT